MDLTPEKLNHGFSYDFPALWSSKPGRDKIVVENASRNLIDCIRIVHRIGLKAWIMYGTLLGLYRDGELISYDRDVDMGFFMSDLDKSHLMKIPRHGSLGSIDALLFEFSEQVGLIPHPRLGDDLLQKALPTLFCIFFHYN